MSGTVPKAELPSNRPTYCELRENSGNPPSASEHHSAVLSEVLNLVSSPDDKDTDDSFAIMFKTSKAGAFQYMPGYGQNCTDSESSYLKNILQTSLSKTETSEVERLCRSHRMRQEVSPPPLHHHAPRSFPIKTKN
jgi:hypothetical protein